MKRTMLAAAAAVVLAGCAGSNASRDRAASQDRAAEQAVSTRPQESGGKNPHPVAKRDPDGTPRYSADETGAQHGSLGGGREHETLTGGRAADARNEVSGRVALVDPQASEIAIDTGGATTQVRVAPDARITLNGERATFQDLRQGVEIRATLDRSGDAPVATRLEATSRR